MKIYRSGKLRGDKIKYPDGVGCSIWRPFPKGDEGTGICFDFIEEEIPNLPTEPKKPKKREKKKKTEAQKKEFVRPTYVHRAFTDGGLRVARDAKPIIMDLLNKKIKEVGSAQPKPTRNSKRP